MCFYGRKLLRDRVRFVFASLLGNWDLVEDTGTRSVTIATSSFELDDFSNMTCHHRVDDRTYVMKSQVPDSW